MKTPKFIQGIKGLLSGILNTSAGADAAEQKPQAETKTPTTSQAPYYDGHDTDRSYDDFYPGRFHGEGGRISSYLGRRF